MKQKLWIFLINPQLLDNKKEVKDDSQDKKEGIKNVIIPITIHNIKIKMHKLLNFNKNKYSFKLNKDKVNLTTTSSRYSL